MMASQIMRGGGRSERVTDPRRGVQGVQGVQSDVEHKIRRKRLLRPNITLASDVGSRLSELLQILDS
jgi:hypothetical protein